MLDTLTRSAFTPQGDAGPGSRSADEFFAKAQVLIDRIAAAHGNRTSSVEKVSEQEAGDFFNTHEELLTKVFGTRSAFMRWATGMPAQLLSDLLPAMYRSLGQKIPTDWKAPSPVAQPQAMAGMAKMAELDIVYFAEQIGENPTEFLEIYRRAQPDQQRELLSRLRASRGLGPVQFSDDATAREVSVFANDYLRASPAQRQGMIARFSEAGQREMLAITEGMRFADAHPHVPATKSTQEHIADLHSLHKASIHPDITHEHIAKVIDGKGKQMTSSQTHEVAKGLGIHQKFGSKQAALHHIHQRMLSRKGAFSGPIASGVQSHKIHEEIHRQASATAEWQEHGARAKQVIAEHTGGQPITHADQLDQARFEHFSEDYRRLAPKDTTFDPVSEWQWLTKLPAEQRQAHLARLEAAARHAGAA
jgi:hypothetical protein